ncbi:tetratricopeptide repeat protein [Kitasatospora sp. NPDC057965]|uniref:tetratricopeptide repeat protein n=1 Tax=Kitasatospora sp. NPDC057965 TaxID=3346291 RepID=UPI0036DA1B7D
MAQEEQDGQAGAPGQRRSRPAAGLSAPVVGSDVPHRVPGGFSTRNRVDGGTVHGNLIQATIVNIHPESAPKGGVEAVESFPGKPIEQWDPIDLEVHPAGAIRITAGRGGPSALPGYVARAHDHRLDTAVAEAAGGRSRMVVLVGSSSTGKTRACWEAVQPLVEHGWTLWHPFDPTRAEAVLADLERVGPRTVVWLNEAQHYLGDTRFGERIAAALHALLIQKGREPVLVLGTLWPEFAALYTAMPDPGDPDPHSRVRELLAGRTVPVPDIFDQDALATAAALAAAGDLLLADALTRARAHGRLAQDLAGAPELLCRYQHGSPAVRALLEAAMDARRLGVGLHLPQAFLTDAATDYLTDHDWDQLNGQWAETAYADLARPVHGKQAPLYRTSSRPTRRPAATLESPPKSSPAADPVLRLADYLEHHGRTIRGRLCPPASFWHAAHTHLTESADLEVLARAAADRRRFRIAYELFRRVEELGSDVRLSLADIHFEIGDLRGAEQLYIEAIADGQHIALDLLGEVQEMLGDITGAEQTYLAAVEAGIEHAEFSLAHFWEGIGNLDGAERIFRAKLDSGHLNSAFHVAWLRLASGDLAGAEQVYLDNLGHIGPRALVDLGILRGAVGDTEGAAQAFHEAAAAGDEAAVVHLSELNQSPRNLQTVEQEFLNAAGTDPSLLNELAELRTAAGNATGAAELYLNAANAGEILTVTPWPYGLEPDGTPSPPWTP